MLFHAGSSRSTQPYRSYKAHSRIRLLIISPWLPKSFFIIFPWRNQSDLCEKTCSEKFPKVIHFFKLRPFPTNWLWWSDKQQIDHLSASHLNRKSVRNQVFGKYILRLTKTQCLIIYWFVTRNMCSIYCTMGKQFLAISILFTIQLITLKISIHK